MIEPRCAACVHWDSRDALTGFCQEVTNHLRHDGELMIQGLATCRTAASGRCFRFDPSQEALREAWAEAKHHRDLRRCAGRDYPASLGRQERTKPCPCSA